MASSSLTVPLAFWVNLPTAPVTTVAYKEGHIVTGLEDGHIWIYRCIINGQGTPQVNFKLTLLYITIFSYLLYTTIHPFDQRNEILIYIVI